MNRKAPVLFLCLAAAVLVLLAYLPSGKEGAPVSYVPMKPVTILVATDPHYLAPGLTDGGEAFLNVVTHADGKYMQRIGEITDALFERAAAGFSAGSTPTNGMSGCAARRLRMAAAVAVLQATTISLQFRRNSRWTQASDRRATSSGGRLPYGQCFVSAM